VKALVTGGAGFIGRWLVRELLSEGIEVAVIDNLSSGSLENISEFINKKGFIDFFKESVNEEKALERIFKIKFDLIFHLAASINVQESIDNPRKTFEEDVVSTVKLLEKTRVNLGKFIFVSTCLVYSETLNKAIDETYPTCPLSPYAGAKLASEKMVLSYYHAYGLPAVILRPFNTYGPYQKTSGEGGVIATFLGNVKAGTPLYIYGDGTQTRDFLYVEDCTRFIYLSGIKEKAIGEVINAGSGKDMSIKELAHMIGPGSSIEYLSHHHPQAEIKKMLCDSTKAKNILGWEPRISLDEGLELTRDWIFK
jgi:nucleoside-diphosphate-sugar epimerase